MLFRASTSDPELARVYRDHVDAVYSFFAFSVDPATAEDLTAATFERAIRSWKRYDAEKASVRTWLLTIARNLLTDHYRRQKHRRGPSIDEHPELIDATAALDDPAATAIAGDALRSWLAVLGEREQQILALHYGADMSADQIAELLDLTRANVHQIISRALRKLRAAAEDQPQRQTVTGRETRPRT